MFALPRITAPPSRRRRVTSASSAGTRPAKSREPTVVGTPGDVDVVLDHDRHPVERQPFARVAPMVDLAGVREGELRSDRDHRVQVECASSSRSGTPRPARRRKRPGREPGIVDERADVVVGHAAATTASSARKTASPRPRARRPAEVAASAPSRSTRCGDRLPRPTAAARSASSSSRAAEPVEHHRGREDRGERIRDPLPGDVRRRAVMPGRARARRRRRPTERGRGRRPCRRRGRRGCRRTCSPRRSRRMSRGAARGRGPPRRRRLPRTRCRGMPPRPRRDLAEERVRGEHVRLVDARHARDAVRRGARARRAASSNACSAIRACRLA